MKKFITAMFVVSILAVPSINYAQTTSTQHQVTNAALVAALEQVINLLLQQLTLLTAQLAELQADQSGASIGAPTPPPSAGTQVPEPEPQLPVFEVYESQIQEQGGRIIVYVPASNELESIEIRSVGGVLLAVATIDEEWSGWRSGCTGGNCGYWNHKGEMSEGVMENDLLFKLQVTDIHGGVETSNTVNYHYGARSILFHTKWQ